MQTNGATQNEMNGLKVWSGKVLSDLPGKVQSAQVRLVLHCIMPEGQQR